MARTYHGITKVSCAVCSWATEETLEMEILNDLGGNCPICNSEEFQFTLEESE